MISLLQELITLLERDSLTLKDVVGRVGKVTDDPGGLQPIVLRPNLPGVRRALLTRHPDSGGPYMLDLEFTLAARPTVAALEAEFGPYSRARTDMLRPREIVFQRAQAGAGWRAVLIAEVAGKPDAIATSKVSKLTFRRDHYK